MKKYWLPAMALGLLANYPAHAEVQINGFASVVMGIDLEDDGNPTADYGGRTVDNLQEAKVALQGSADFRRRHAFCRPNYGSRRCIRRLRSQL